MRISLTHDPIRKGLLFKKTYYQVSVTVLFTHEELQIIRHRGLQKTKLMDRRPATAKVDDRDEKFELRLSELMNGKTDRFLCATPSKAKIYEDELMGMLAQVKLWIGDNAEVGSPSVTEF